MKFHGMTIAATLILASFYALPALAQNSSLMRRPGLTANGLTTNNAPFTLEQSSLIYKPLPPILGRKIQKHDLVTVRVDLKSQMLTEGDVQRRKNTLYDAVLSDWILLDGLKSIKPSPQSDGDPRANGQLNQLFRAEGEIETRESLTFDITAHVVEIRPNGNLILEGHATYQTNNEVWEYSLTGECRRDDIDPGNVILSKFLADPRVFRRQRGHVRDSYKRGWLTRWMDRFGAF